MSFVHLHTHTEYSLLDGSNKIKEYVARVKSMGMNAAAITDHGVMFGVIDFYKAALEAGIKPILGCEIYVAPGSRFDREAGTGDDRYYHLVLLAENNTGYQNLMKIVSIGFTEGYYYKPRVDMEVLERYHQGIIALSACLAGEIPRNIVRGFRKEAREAALRYQEIFGKDNYFLELQDHGIDMQKTVNRELLSMSKELDIPLVATNDIHYTYREDEEPHDILLCLQTGKKLDDTDRMRYEGGQYYVKSEEEMQRLFPFAPEALENTQKIADRCNVTIEFHKTKLPHFDIPPEYADSKAYLRHLCEKGLKERYPDDDGTLHERMEYELSVIEKMGYVDYFLIVWDYIHYAREHGISVGPGRGSAAGAVVSYALKITDIDPIKYDLLFERFLNPERVSMPDIDVDFGFERRQEVIDYVVEKYGRSKCVQIVTFGTLAAKGVIRDVTRVMDLPYSFGDRLSKMIPNELNITLQKALEENNDLRKLYETDEEVHKVIDMCKRLEGLPRHASMHAAGILITPEDADKYVPLSRGSNGEITTQFTMTTLEELGLLKMDFLGLRTLTVIQNAVKYANKRHPGLNLDIDRIDYDDKKVLDYIGTGDTDGIFQLESGGMQRFMKDLKPESLEDIIAGIALYRPGPMDFIPKYIAGKRNVANVQYDCPELEPILKPTYGCIVYQEQVMQIVQQLGGYTLGRADLLRRAMSKKKQHVMEEEQENFVHGNKEQGVPGCISKGISEGTAKKIYGEMLDFAKYAFNKSHAACYAYVTMQTAFLKYYYPVEFMAALLTSVIDNASKMGGYMLSCRSMGIELLPPDVNEAEAGFTPAGDRSIRYGMAAIKSVGIPTIQTIIREREQRGKFSNLQDFLDRVSGTEVNKRAVEAFIKAGVFDSLGGTRKQYISVYQRMMDSAAEERKNNLSGQMSIFDLMGGAEAANMKGIALPDCGEFPKEQILFYEKEVLGIYLSGHPLDQYEDLWKKNINAKTTDFYLNPETNTVGLTEGRRVTIGGLISSVVTKQTKRGDTMAILSVEDLTGAVECIVWPNQYMSFANYLKQDNKVFLTGRVKVEDEKDGQLIVDAVQSFDEMPRKLYIRFADKSDYERRNPAISQILFDSEGRDKVIIFLNRERQQKVLPASQNVRADDVLIGKLSEIVGQDNVRLV
ncbi:MAG: DNA polymerase III subunit alpha [Lachnospiraceae bacterium]|nr:DNA polymerase III subunit alpha [Lachnospiraceae bacterium]